MKEGNTITGNYLHMLLVAKAENKTKNNNNKKPNKIEDISPRDW